jgi:LysR family glycine cleavage system transcriptional activator
MSNLRRRLPSPHSLFVFEAAARTLNFRLAADELNVTQPSISHAIKELERFHGVKLFVRMNRGVQLTEAGRTLYEGVRLAFDRIERDLKAIAAGETHYITFAASTSLAAHWLVPQFHGFQQANPGTRIKVVTTDRDVEPDFEIDMTIWLRPRDFRRKNSWLICDEVIFPICSPLYLGRARPIASVSDLHEHPLLHSVDPHRKRVGWAEWLTEIGAEAPELAPSIVFNDYQLVVQAALAGEGVALGWRLTAQLLLRSGLLVRPVEDQLVTGKSFFVITNEAEEPSEEMMALVEWIVAEANR